ncbi:glycosyltransferase [Sphingomonas sp. ABOLD]|uniref:Glycosyltransferase involved in cell wall biosynthesis n=1 Tax=Sphingomonas trueperi TaxID=53317 RepID=A0A7X5XYI6_9SPHN|nr:MULTISPECIES: glycosyltransferase [Sphingomonas]NJB97721.1 glycosyltransferase involved in cell wall biosynthesis [Sphingomonas trueperi]RSV52919.1 glycosyltransferase [Sphingomonas sp. ABOLD]
MSDAPTLSVVMATYEGAALLPETLASLQAQSFGDWELVAVDDGSRDDTVAVLRSVGDPRIRVIESAVNGGPVVARNRAFAAARGRYVAGLDQDDLCLPDRFARQVAWLDAHPGTVLVSTATDCLVEGRVRAGQWVRPLTPGLIDWLMLVQNPLVWSSVLFRAEAARRLAIFERPECRYVEDFDLYHRLRAFGRIDQIDTVLTLYRQHAGGASQVFNGTMAAHAETLLRARHRALLGEGAPDIAGLLVRYVMARTPIGDFGLLRRLFDGIAVLRAHFGAQGQDAATLARVDREISRLWWRLCRTAVRSGRLPLRHALAARPAAAALGDARPVDLAASGLIGAVRALAHRRT